MTPKSSEELREALNDAVMSGVNRAIERAVEKQTEGRPQAVSQHGVVYQEHGASIELPDGFDGNLEIVGQLLGNVFGSMAVVWLSEASGYDFRSFQVGYSFGQAESKIPEVVWRIWPEFDVQHSQVPAPPGYQGETFKDFAGDTDRRFMWGPWLAKFYMRFHVITDTRSMKAGAAA